jgi:hypothetical protein
MAIAAIGPARSERGDRLVAVRMVVNPTTDAEFRARAEALSETANTPEELQRRLRAHYAHARVVRGVTDIVERWYVYRDGHWINSQERSAAS